jgi:cell filamentation protein, protein adenylyltransferase
MLMNELESDILARHTPVRSSERASFVASLAETHTELLLVHPFRDGNGRMARLLAILMCWRAGLRAPAFEDMLKRRTAEYFAAVCAGLERNYDPMRDLFSEMVCGDEA